MAVFSERGGDGCKLSPSSVDSRTSSGLSESRKRLRFISSEDVIRNETKRGRDKRRDLIVLEKKINNEKAMDNGFAPCSNMSPLFWKVIQSIAFDLAIQVEGIVLLRQRQMTNDCRDFPGSGHSACVIVAWTFFFVFCQYNSRGRAIRISGHFRQIVLSDSGVELLIKKMNKNDEREMLNPIRCVKDKELQRYLISDICVLCTIWTGFSDFHTFLIFKASLLLYEYSVFGVFWSFWSLVVLRSPRRNTSRFTW